MNKLLFIILIALSGVTHGSSLPQKISEADFVLGKSLTISSEVLDEQRVLNVYLPASYNDGEQKDYPVIYLLDGSEDEDFIHIAGLVQFASFPWIKTVPESIVVGIANVDRKRDFTYPSNNELDQREFPTSGQSAAFISFLAQELQPFIEGSFRTTNHKTLIGQSLGGLVTTEILFSQQQLFNNYVIVSPSLWWDDEKLLQQHVPKLMAGTSIYIAVGNEGEVMERVAKQLYEKLVAIDSQGSKLRFDFLEDRNHGDALHLAVYNAFSHFYRDN
ncbi:alpha/beta hydrolase [Pseudoalteromonas sp. GB56]